MCKGRKNINGGGRSYHELFLLGEKEKKYFDGLLWVCSWMFFKVMVQSIVPRNAGLIKGVFS